MPTEPEAKKIAIVHDWLVGGGAEKVVYELHKMFPDAPIYTSYCTPEWREKLDNKVITGFLQKWPFPALRKFVPFLRIWWFTRLDLRKYELVISSSGAEAKGVHVMPTALHIAYIHAPTHYYWSRYAEYLAKPGFGKFDGLARFGLKVLVAPLRNWDYAAAQRPDYLIANSTHTQTAIQTYYGRESDVIFPPVDTEKFGNIKAGKRTGFVITSRQTPYKRVDLAVAACTELELPLTVIGKGPEFEKLKTIAGPTITFTGFIEDDTEVSLLIAGAEAFIFPGVDDFGIAPVEAMAAGTPVIAYKAGGALDFVVPGKTGEFFTEQTVEALVETLKKFDSSSYDARDIKSFASQFSAETFQQKLTNYINENL